MSLFGTTYHALMPAPLTTHKFIITWPDLIAQRVFLLAEATTYPQIKLGYVSIPCYGSEIHIPSGVVESDHIWRVRVSEDFLGSVKECILSFNTKVENMETRTETQTVTVMIPNQLDVPLSGFQLKNCWLAGRQAVDLDMSNPTNVFKWNLEFHYTVCCDLSLLNRSLNLSSFKVK